MLSARPAKPSRSAGPFLVNFVLGTGRFLRLHQKAEGRAPRGPKARTTDYTAMPHPPAQAPATHKVTRPGHFSPGQGATAPSPETARMWYPPEVTSRPPRAASGPTGSGLRRPVDPRTVEGEVTLVREWGLVARSWWSLGEWGAARVGEDEEGLSGCGRRVPGLSPAPVRPRSCRLRRHHGPRVWEAGTGAACDHLQLVAFRAARLPALLQQGHPQRAAPHPGVHPSRGAA